MRSLGLAKIRPAALAAVLVLAACGADSAADVSTESADELAATPDDGPPFAGDLSDCEQIGSTTITRGLPHQPTPRPLETVVSEGISTFLPGYTVPISDLSVEDTYVRAEIDEENARVFLSDPEDPTTGVVVSVHKVYGYWLFTGYSGCAETMAKFKGIDPSSGEITLETTSVIDIEVPSDSDGEP
ncbi:MAG TPA: hypothetical protein VMW08_04105 [Acidimicrobiales bacterium]|nr:hypothetical protein [Acidimicrobiales bacterium]